jgi:hypothetical protein
MVLVRTDGIRLANQRAELGCPKASQQGAWWRRVPVALQFRSGFVPYEPFTYSPSVTGSTPAWGIHQPRGSDLSVSSSTSTRVRALTASKAVYVDPKRIPPGLQLSMGSWKRTALQQGVSRPQGRLAQMPGFSAAERSCAQRRNFDGGIAYACYGADRRCARWRATRTGGSCQRPSQFS